MHRRPPPRPTIPVKLAVKLVLMPVLMLSLSACGPQGKPAPGAPAAASAAVVTTGDFGGTDLAWVELMIPMDEQLLPVLDLVRERSADQGLVALAGELHGVYDTELPRLRAISDAAGLPKDNPHKGHKMPGLVDADRLAAMRGSSGAEFDRQAVDCLREHLEQLARLAGSEIANGTSAAVKDLARAVEQNRSTAAARLPAAS